MGEVIIKVGFFSLVPLVFGTILRVMALGDTRPKEKVSLLLLAAICNSVATGWAAACFVLWVIATSGS
jgi:hypothetical protein